MRREKLIRLALESKKVLVIENPLDKMTLLKKGSIIIGLYERYPVRMDIRDVHEPRRLTYQTVAKLLGLKE